jgi:hypothetical protein
MTFNLYLNAKIILNSKFSIIYLFCITKKQRALTWKLVFNYFFKKIEPLYNGDIELVCRLIYNTALAHLQLVQTS